MWKQWREKSLSIIDKKKIQYVLFADIAAFYENIDLQKLRSDLNDYICDNELLEMLMRMLNLWSQPRGRGIPQGMSASDILAKIYMASIDQALINDDFLHLRYVDDIRIFCHNELEAKRALVKLNGLLRDRGLNLQSAKTEILHIEQARTKIDGVTSVINSVNERLKQDLMSIGMDVSATPSNIGIAFEDSPEKISPDVLEQTFKDHFLSNNDKSFDKTLLHYLLTRLGKAESNIAVDYCIKQLSVRPEETEYVLRYLACFTSQQHVFDSVIEYLRSDSAIYDYQNYLIVRWIYEQQVFPESLLDICRKWAFDRNIGQWLRTYCVTVLGSAGDKSDLNRIESVYNNVVSDIEKAEHIVALRNLEKSRRNSFYGRVRKDLFFSQCAIRYVKEKDKIGK